MTSDDDVRRLLAALDGHDRREPPELPADVAARLDARLASLGGERDRAPEDAIVVPLRRRVRPALAAAAAAVLVAGGGAAVAGGLLTGGSGDHAASSEAGGSAAVEDAPQQPDSPEAAAEGGGSLRTLRAAPELQRGDLAEQVRQLVAEGTLRLDPGATAQRGQAAQVRGAGCVSPGAEGAQLGVRYDADSATLVVGVADGEARDVRIFACSGDRVLAQTQVPADLVPR